MIDTSLRRKPTLAGARRDFAGLVDAVVIFRRPDAMPVQIRDVAEQELTAVWLPPGTWRCAAGTDAQLHHLVLVMI
jgi:predicted CoA-binding protein